MAYAPIFICSKVNVPLPPVTYAAQRVCKEKGYIFTRSTAKVKGTQAIPTACKACNSVHSGVIKVSRVNSNRANSTIKALTATSPQVPNAGESPKPPDNTSPSQFSLRIVNHKLWRVVNQGGKHPGFVLARGPL